MPSELGGAADRAPRFPAYMGAQYTRDHLALRAHVYDLSTSGAFVATETPDEPGAEASLLVGTPLARDPVVVRCRVARAGDQPCMGMGLAFVDPEPEARGTFERYCAGFNHEPRVVMVDDEPPILRMMGRFFEHEGYGFIGIDQPVETEQTLKRFRPDLVILDLMMPVVSGVDVARRLRDNPETHDIPVIFFSASWPHLLPEDLRHIPFVQKGDSREELMARVTERIGSGTRARP